MSSLSYDRRSSSFNPTFSDDTSPLLFTNAHFYGALFEFCPGTQPHILWEYGRADVSDYESFKMFIVNEQAPFAPLSSTSEEPTIVQSTYENMNYFAIYSCILDVEAKSFTRPIVLIISNINPQIINHVYHLYVHRFIDYVKQLKTSAERYFKHNLKLYTEELLKCIEIHSEKSTKLQKKYKEIEKTINYYQIKDINYENAKIRSPEYFLLLHNNLQPLESLANLSDIISSLDKFITEIPTTLLCSSIAVHADVNEYDPQMQFSGVDKLHGYSTLAFRLFSRNFTDDRYNLRGFVSNQIFYHCAYTLLSGHTLIICSDNTHIALSLAKKFCVLVPFFQESYLRVIDEANSSSCLQYSVVVSKTISNPKQFENFASVLDLDKNKYRGFGCPQTSFVISRLGNLITASERAFLLSLYTELKKIATYFIIVIYTNASHIEKSPEKIFQGLKEKGISKDDEPIFNFWLMSFFNKHKMRPILKKTYNIPYLVLNF